MGAEAGEPVVNRVESVRVSCADGVGADARAGRGKGRESTVGAKARSIRTQVAGGLRWGYAASVDVVELATIFYTGRKLVKRNNGSLRCNSLVS